MANDDVLIVGKLDSKELTDSIDKLINDVANKTTVMANTFTQAMDKMSTAMKDFAITQKVSVDLIKESWRTMSSEFDAMFEAEKGATGGGKGGGKPRYPDNTIGALEQEIALEEQKRKAMQLDSDELRKQNLLLEQQTNKLKEQKKWGTEGAVQKQAKELFATYNALSTRTLPQAELKLRVLKDLQDTLRNTKIFNDKEWNRLETAIDNVKTKIERLKKKGSSSGGATPDNFFDIKNLMPESSIEEITAKMKALRQVKTQDASETKLLGDEYQRLKRKQHDLMGSSIQLTRSNNYLAQSFGYIRNRIVYALTLGAITSFTKQIYEIRGQYEMLERSLGVLVNSFERGSQVFQELNRMALESPFTLMELASGAKQLTAYNFAADEVVDTTRRLADISSALGVPMERLVYNLGQIRAQTVLNARDARDFANAGLPVIKMLSEYYTELEGKVVSTGDVYSRMSKKMVSYNDVMTVINRTTDQGGKFFEFQAKQAKTLKVQMANLTLAWNNMLNELGEANQEGVISITTPIKLLKTLLQNWESVNRVIKNLVITFGLLKVAQMVAIRQGYAWASYAGSTAKIMGTLGNAINNVGKSLSALFANPWTWVFVGVAAVTDLIGKWRAARAEIVALNEDIIKTSKEASQANIDFLNNKGNKETRSLAKENRLSAEAADKAWQSIEEQLRTSSDAAQIFLTKLWAIDDTNKRVVEGFNYVERIQQAQAALVDLGRTEIKVTQDSGWWGIFGEGLVSDLKDLDEALQGIASTANLFDKEGRVDKNVDAIWEEYSNELEKTAQSINNFIQEHKITDPLQMTEILGRVKTIIKQKNPEIKGELETLFDVTLDKRVSYLTNGAVDENLSLWKQFMERLKHNSSSAFQDITKEWATNDEKLSKEQQEAVDANLEYFKNTMPFYYESVKNMVEDASRLKIQIGLTFNAQQTTDFQKQVKDRINNAAGALDFGNQTMWGTLNDDLTSWVDTQQKAIKSLKEDNKLLAKDESQWAKDKIAANNREMQQRKNLLDLFHQSYAADNKGGKKREDVLGKTLEKEVEIITNLQSRFKEYQKAGVDAQTAIAKATDEYGSTLLRTNTTLNKYGFKTKSSEQLANMDLRSVRDYLNGLLATATALGNAKGIEAIEKAIARINVEITKVDYKHITDSLNNELGKLKDEYELGIELDANPELGGIFADMFDINLDELPKTAEEYASMYTERLNIAFKKLGADIELPDLVNLTRDDLEEFANMVKENKLNEVVYELIKKGYDATHQALEQQTRETVKSWESLLEKYAEYETKLTKIATDAENERKVARRMNAPQWVFDAINNMEKERKAQAAFEKFQKEPEWLIATGDLAGMTDQSLRGLVNTLEDYKKKGNQ